MRPVAARSTVVRMVVAYVVLAGSWILVSDLVLFRWVDDGLSASLLKGAAFVAVTAVLLGVLLHRHERDLRRREREVSLFDELSEDLVYHVRFEPEQHFVFVSRAANTMVGYTPEEHYADPQLGLRLVHPDDRHLLAGTTELEGALRLRWRDRDGRLLWTEQRNVPEFIDGRQVGIIGVARDVTAQVLEERSRRSAARLDRALLGGTALEPALRALASELAELLDAARVELHARDLAGRSWRVEVGSPDGRPQAADPTAGEPLAGRHERGQVVVILRVGSPRVDLVARILDPLAQRVVDAADQYRRSVELRRLEKALEASGSAVVLAARDGTIEWVNPAFTQITGYGPDETRGATPRVLKSGVQSSAFYDELWVTITAGRAFRGELVNRRRDGRQYVASVTIDPVVDEHGEVIGFVGVQKDVTDEQAARAELHERERRALQRERDLERDRIMLVQVLSHELRTPLTITLGAARTLQRDGLDPGVRAELTAAMQRASDDLLERLDAIILVTDDVPLRTEPVQLEVLLAALIDGLSPRFDPARIELTGTAHLCSDPVLLRALMRPLVDNALKYSAPPSPVKVTIVSATTAASGVTEVHVIDRGPGIDPALRDLLEQPLRQLDASTTRGSGGLGFGLTAARRAAERLGAVLQIETAAAQDPGADVGTALTVQLPELAADPADDR